MTSRADAARASIKSIINSIKDLEPGFEELADDAPLFNDGSDRLSPINLDSLDALDLAMAIGDEFGLNNDEFEDLVSSEDGFDRLRTVNDITDLVLSLTSEGSDSSEIEHQGKEVTA